jgi:hypothetical protein
MFILNVLHELKFACCFRVLRYDRFTRTTSCIKTCANVMRLCPVASVEPGQVLALRQQAGAGDQPLAATELTRSGFSSLVAIELTALRVMFIDFEQIQPAERFVCKSMVELKAMFSIRFQAAIKGSIPLCKARWGLVTTAANSALDSAGADDAIKAALTKMLSLEACETFELRWNAITFDTVKDSKGAMGAGDMLAGSVDADALTALRAAFDKMQTLVTNDLKSKVGWVPFGRTFKLLVLLGGSASQVPPMVGPRLPCLSDLLEMPYGWGRPEADSFGGSVGGPPSRTQLEVVLGRPNNPRLEISPHFSWPWAASAHRQCPLEKYKPVSSCLGVTASSSTLRTSSCRT